MAVDSAIMTGSFLWGARTGLAKPRVAKSGARGRRAAVIVRARRRGPIAMAEARLQEF